MTADLLYWIVLFLILVIGFLILRFCKEKIKKELSGISLYHASRFPRSL